MKKKLVTVLVIIAIVLALGIAGALGFVWYRDNHVFIEGDAYPLNSTQIDLTGEEISIDYYEQLQSKLPDCNIRWLVPFHGGKYPSDTESLTISELTVEDELTDRGELTVGRHLYYITDEEQFEVLWDYVTTHGAENRS